MRKGGRTKPTGTRLAVALAMLLAPGLLAEQATAADFTPGPGSYTANTTTFTLTGPGVNFAGTNVNGVAVFTFETVNLPAGATLNVIGNGPFKLVATESLTVAGVINGSGTDASNFSTGPFPGGPGGGAGGTNGATPGTGPGGGGVGDESPNHGGGGGGFGGTGARGGVTEDPPGTVLPGMAGAGGASYGDLDVTLQGGSGGGGASDSSPAGGGGGGGAIALFSPSVTIAGSGEVRADGGNGAVGGFSASGGGSGGGIIINGDTLNVQGLLSAAGGDGGGGGCCGDGGGGGGGRVSYQYGSLTASGTATVTGGQSGVAGGFGSGEPSPEAAGAVGVVTQIPAPDTKITKAKVKDLKGKATFEFGAIGTASGFECALKRPGKSGEFGNCESPIKFKKLKKGKHTFSVRATNVGGTDPSPATEKFKIK